MGMATQGCLAIGGEPWWRRRGDAGRQGGEVTAQAPADDAQDGEGDVALAALDPAFRGGRIGTAKIGPLVGVHHPEPLDD